MSTYLSPVSDDEWLAMAHEVREWRAGHEDRSESHDDDEPLVGDEAQAARNRALRDGRPDDDDDEDGGP